MRSLIPKPTGTANRTTRGLGAGARWPGVRHKDEGAGLNAHHALASAW